jgi:putative redox protein
MDLISISQEKDSKFCIEIRNHVFYSDMSVQDGGKDEAPSPAEFLVSSLGACIGMIINTYCQLHGHTSENIGLSMTYVLADNPKRIQNITIDIALPEYFPEDRRQAILNSVKSCVIFNTLSENTEIDIDFE